MTFYARSAAAAALLIGLQAVPALAQDTWTYPVYDIKPPRAAASDAVTLPELSDFTSIAPSEVKGKSKLCLLLPQAQDAVFLAYINGAVSEAQRLGQSLTVFDAGGYSNDTTQRSQFENCLSLGVNAIMIEPINPTGWESDLARAKDAGIKVVNAIEGIDAEVDGRSIVDFNVNGLLLGQHIAKEHPAGGEPAHVLVLPGGAGIPFVEATVAGVKKGLEGSSAVVDDVIYADMTETAQLKTVEDALVAHPEVNYIVGNAMAVKQAVNVLAQQGMTDKVKLLTTYLDTDVVNYIATGEVWAGTAESSVMITKIAVDLAVRAINGDTTVHDVIPSVGLVTQENATDPALINANFPPEGWAPVFSVE